MSKTPSLKSLNNFLNDLLERKSSKKQPFVQPERRSERRLKNSLKLLNTLSERLNGSPTTLSRQGGSVRSER